MAGEVVVTDVLGNGGDVISYNILDGSTCPKGSIMELADGRTIQVCTATNKALAGVLCVEKTASDGVVKAGVYTNIVGKFTVSGGGVTLGAQVVVSSAANYIKDLDTLDEESGDIIGYALETATDGETVHVRVTK